MKHNQYGYINSLLVPLILTVILLIGSIGFGIWAFNSRQAYKYNTDQKINAAVTTAVAAESAKKDAVFAQAEKYPLATYNGPEAYGSIILKYPKTWSGYVNATGNGNGLVDGYFNPGVVPAIGGQSTTFALRLQVAQEPYNQLVQQYDGLQQNGTTTVVPYRLPKVPSVVGIEATGQLLDGKTGTSIILPLRTNSLVVWTEGTQYINDFNNNILPNLTFSP